MKTYTIQKYRKGRYSDISGTLDELTKYFAYTLECGNSWNKKINRTPKTIKSLVSNINKSYQETQGQCYDQESVTLIA